MVSDDLKFKLIASAGIVVVAYFVVRSAANAGSAAAQAALDAAGRAYDNTKAAVMNNPVYNAAGSIVPNAPNSNEVTLGGKFWAWWNPDAVAAENAELGSYNSKIPAVSAGAIGTLEATQNGYGTAATTKDGYVYNAPPVF